MASSVSRGSLVLIGFMGAGKTTAAQDAAELLGLDWLDVDSVIEQRLSKPVGQIFSEDGEPAFRAIEEQVTLELLHAPEPRLLALGGGAVGSAAVRNDLLNHHVLWIDVDVDTAWRRVQGAERPLARDRGQFERLYREREPIYSEVADAIVIAGSGCDVAPVLAALEDLPDDLTLLWASGGSGGYPVYVGGGAMGEIKRVEGRRFLVTDGTVDRLYGEEFQPLQGRVSVMPGEQSKTVAHAEIVWTELMRAGMTRQDLVVALGGGVVGDLAGFCAATYQRGVRYVQVPTTLVAQIDSAYGGKTGVDLSEAKNYVGAYHQPSAVLTDPGVLRTLPPEELAAGYAEVVKTALIAGGSLWERVRSGADPADRQLIIDCVRTKLRVVAADERDTGLRQVLNLGHTVGHAIEATTGYARYRHGEAVALGLLAALRLSGREDLRSEVRELFVTHGLRLALDGTNPEEVVAATARDKKRVGDDPVPFVLLDEPGRPRPGCTVGSQDLLAAVRELAVR
jgi:shikimate kinase/3-dehydroquinate synthase